MVLFEHWKHSPTCCIVNPVMHIYKKMANCSSNMTYFESMCPSKCSSVIIVQNISFWTPNCDWMHSGWPQRSSRTHWWPEIAEVWYGIRLCWSSARMLWSVIRRAWISLKMLPMSGLEFRGTITSTMTVTTDIFMPIYPWGFFWSGIEIRHV